MGKSSWVVVLIICIAGVASGDPELEQKRDNGAAALAGKVKTMNEECGTSIAVTYDRKAEPDKICANMYCGYQICIDVVTGIYASCSHKDLKALVAEKIQSIACHYSEGSAKRNAANNHAPELALKDGALDVQFDAESNGIGHEAAGKFVKKLSSSIYTDGPRCKKLRDPVSKLQPEEAEEAAKKLTKPKDMSDTDFTVCHKIQLEVLGTAASDYRFRHSPHASSSGNTAKVMHCKTDCAAQCHAHSPGDACQQAISKCQKACE